VGVATTEWFGALPGFGPALVRNFIADEAMSDRFFSLLMFVHIGVPLALLAAMWVHIQRLTRPRTSPSRSVQAWTMAALLLVSAALPALSLAQADLQRVPLQLPIDWFYLAAYPAMYASSAQLLWALSGGLTLALLAAPWLVRAPRPVSAKVDPGNCNGCGRCFADCPYAAIAMVPHPGGRGLLAVVNDDLCAACGICAGACPSSTPFRSGQRLATGIDLPQQPVDELRRRLEAGLESARRAGQPAPVVVFACQRGAGVAAGDARVRAWGVPCAAMVPPSFVEYALRSGAAGVMLASCPPEDCEFRFGARWAQQRLEGEREPHLRADACGARVRIAHAAREDRHRLREQIDRFLAEVSNLPPGAPAPVRRAVIGDAIHG